MLAFGDELAGIEQAPHQIFKGCISVVCGLDVFLADLHFRFARLAGERQQIQFLNGVFVFRELSGDLCQFRILAGSQQAIDG